MDPLEEESKGNDALDCNDKCLKLEAKEASMVCQSTACGLA